MNPKFILQCCLWVLLLFSHIKLSYNFNQAWWHSMAGTGVAFILGWVIWRNRFLQVSGLQMTKKEVVSVIGSAILFVTISALLMLLVAQQNHVQLAFSDLRNYTHNFFYIVNEEMIMGALMLHFLKGRLRLAPLLASAVLAAVLALAHLVLYKWYFRDHGMLLTTTVITLFFVCFLKNNLILRYGHIGYSWAVHFGWMAVMYGSLHVSADTGEAVSDLQKFNMYLGSPLVLGISALAAAYTIAYSRAATRPSASA